MPQIFSFIVLFFVRSSVLEFVSKCIKTTNFSIQFAKSKSLEMTLCDYLVDKLFCTFTGFVRLHKIFPDQKPLIVELLQFANGFHGTNAAFGYLHKIIRYFF